MKNIKQGIKMLEHIKNFCVGALVFSSIALIVTLIIYFNCIILPIIVIIAFVYASYILGREIREN
ncbi:hypothetical protein [Campylobacter phage CP39]|nr:hypothetical protein [Campylobacter phage CP39]